MVPSGYPNDSFPLMVETGKRVIVTPASQVNNFNDPSAVNELKGIRASLHSLTKITLQNREVISNLYLDSKLLATSVTKTQDDWDRGNIKINR